MNNNMIKIILMIQKIENKIHLIKIKKVNLLKRKKNQNKNRLNIKINLNFIFREMRNPLIVINNNIRNLMMIKIKINLMKMKKKL